MGMAMPMPCIAVWSVVQRMMKVLIVDDEDNFRDYLKQAVDWGRYGPHRLYDARDGRSALSLAEKIDFSMVLADIEMPLMNGLECAEAIKRINPECEIILISGFDKFAYAKTALRIGIMDFLVKPVSPPELEAALDSAVRKLAGKKRGRLDEYFAGSAVFDGPAQRQAEHSRANPGGGPGPGGDERRSGPQKTRLCLARALREGDEGQIARLLEQYVRFMKNDSVPAKLMGSLCTGLVTICLEELGRLGIPLRQVFQSDFSPYLDICLLSDMDSLLEYLVGVYGKTLSAIHRKNMPHARRLVREAKMRIETGYGDPDFSIGALAKSMYVTEGYLRKQFKQESEPAPNAYLKNIRMQKALQLMRDAGKTISEAAALTGFRDASYFSKCFKLYYGFPPSYCEDA
jgi:two-component system response regulator YesN